MAVAHADCDDAAEGIQVPAPLFIIDILHGTFNDHYGPVIVSNQGRSQIALAHIHHLFRRWTGVMFDLMMVLREFGGVHDASSYDRIISRKAAKIAKKK